MDVAPREELVTLRRAAFLLGRAVFGGYFVYNGINHLQNRAAMTAYASSKGVQAADMAVPATGAMLLFGGASVIAGAKPRLGIASLLGFLAAITPKMHRFWDVADPQQRAAEQVQFLKNLALAGACLMMLEIPEPWNVDTREFEFDLEVEPTDAPPLLAA
jgi:putative oxidoreductase